MPSTTENERILLKKGTELTRETGYDLVVLEDNSYIVYGDGRLPEKKKGLFSKKPKITEVHAVSNDTRHSFTFKKPVRHSDGIHNFFTTISFYYRVGDPIQLVKQARRDPVEKLKEEIGKVIVGYLRGAAWQNIRNPQLLEQLRANAAEEYVSVGRGEAVPLFERISDFARDYGLEFIELGFDVDLPEGELDDRFAEDETVKKTKISDEETKLDLHVRKNEHRKKTIDQDFNDELADDAEERRAKRELRNQWYQTQKNAIGTMGRNITENIHSIDDAAELLEGFRRLGSATGNGETSNSIGDGNGGSASFKRLGSGDTMVDSLAALIADLREAKLGVGNQKVILSSLFHLVGAKLSDAGEEDARAYVAPILEIEVSQDLKEHLLAKLKEVTNRIESNNLL